MAPPSQVAIATSALQRLVKEESSYHKELDQQKARIVKLEKGETEDRQNLEYQLKQEQRALEETKAVIPTIHDKIANAVDKLESVLDQGQTNDVERQNAAQVLKEAKEVIEA
ncbi:hypothetical protein DV735_g1983, partial [Chaetothyriales sp. CBS 134920]